MRNTGIDYHDVDVTCSTCGATYHMRSTAPGPRLTVDICSNCHPFYRKDTNRMSTVRGSQVDRFRRRYGVKLV